MGGRHEIWVRGVFAVGLALGLSGCDDEDKGDESGDSGNGSSGGTPADSGGMNDGGSTSGTPPGDSGAMWVVGEEGEMLRWSHDGVGRYPVDVDQDFADIACRGSSQAWVVGQAGTLIETHDAGATWTVIGLGASEDLAAVAASDGGMIWVVGDGVAFTSPDEGATWSAVEAPAASYTSVATDLLGEQAWLTTFEGDVIHVDAGIATTVYSGDVAITDVAASADGQIVVAVGELGTVLRSDDGGQSFAPLPVPTVRDLDTVQIARAGGLVVAGGAAGVVVKIDFEAGVTAQELLDPSLTLHALHIDAQGHGQAIGDAGVALQTSDAGDTWTPVSLGTELDLHGIDHPGALHL